jgi:hypothetical protein
MMGQAPPTPPGDGERRVLGRYRLDERLASGGSAEVWRARDEQLDRDVAVKLLHPHLLPDERSRDRLAAEARAAAGLSHPGIVGVYDVDTTGEAPAVVFELVDGESLADRLARDGALPEREAARIAAEIGEALFHAHQRGVVHRDVKPGNILIAADGRARLVDFGIARLLDEAAERLTMTGTVMGTLRYMAPEQLAGGEIGPRADLWALGAVLYEMLVGRPPFSAPNQVALADEQRTVVPDLGGVNAGLASIAAASLAVEPEDRPRHVGAVAAALRGWLGNGSVDAALLAPVPAVSPDADTAAVPVAATAQPAPERPGHARSARGTSASWPLVLALLAAVLVVAFLALNAARGALPGSSASASASSTFGASPTATVASTPTAVPTLDIGSLPKPVRDEVGKYLEACGDGAPLPDNLASMNKKAAEDYFAPLIEACGGG